MGPDSRNEALAKYYTTLNTKTTFSTESERVIILLHEHKSWRPNINSEKEKYKLINKKNNMFSVLEIK